MQSIKNEIMYLPGVREFIEFATDSKKIVCIGVDGPTASGKTIFAELLKSELKKRSKKKIQIVPLDSLLVDRSFRENSLQKITKAGIPFEHEAELHMEFYKLFELLKLLRQKKRGLATERKVVLKKLYSRLDKGRCTAELTVDVCEECILIFEGHYTTRPEFFEVLDKNFILLAKREELIKRKIDRVSDYRDKSEVIDYFDLIDEPSYLSNYYRFADLRPCIIDNSDFLNPFVVAYDHIEKLLDTNKFLYAKSILSDQISEFVFGVHGVSKSSKETEKKFKQLLSDLDNLKNLKNRKVVSKTCNLNKILHKVSYFDYVSNSTCEIGLYMKLFERNVTWIVRKNTNQICHLIFWEGGVFKIQDGQVRRVNFLNNKKVAGNVSFVEFWDTISVGKGFLSKVLLENNLKESEYACCFLDNPNRVSFLVTALSHTQYCTRSLGDFFIISSRGCLPHNIEQTTAKPEILNLDEINLSLNTINYQETETDYYYLTQDFLILKQRLNNKVIQELRDIYFNDENQEVRNAIMQGLLNKDNVPYVPAELHEFLNFSFGFFPSSMSRLYSVKRMGLENTNVMAANIYDLSEDPIDSSVYLECAASNSYPTILQISLNAVGQSETDSKGLEIIGYLKPRNGIFDFTNSICNEIVKLLSKSESGKLNQPFFGIGLDHVDVRGDVPSGRARRFSDQAIKTEAVTHLTLDGSSHFQPLDKSKDELIDAYVKVFKTSLSFLNIEQLNDIDLEFCTGELNYIGEETTPHYPDGEEMSLLPVCFEQALIGIMNPELKATLSNCIKLYVGNLGTTHHGRDTIGSLKLNLAEDWQNSLSGTNFVSPVLHGTTGSSEETFDTAAQSCHKINIAGSFLKVLLESLNPAQKTQLGFTKFDDTSKFLCRNLHKIEKSKVEDTRKALKNEFVRYCNINNVRSISKQTQKFVRKPFFGRNNIAVYIFSRMEQMLA